MFTRAMIGTLLAGALACGAASAEDGAPASGAGETADPVILDGSAQRALDGARERWRTHGFRSYRQELSRGCFCATAGNVLEVTVGGGRLRRPVPPDVAAVATVPRQFRVVQRAIDDRVSGLTVRYGRRGNPVAISVDTSRLIADEEVSYRTHRLVRAGRR